MQDDGGDCSARSSAGSSSKSTPAEKFFAMRVREPAKRLLVFDQSGHRAWGPDGASEDELQSEAFVQGSSVCLDDHLHENYGRLQPELHDVAERLWDFAQHVDRIEKHKMALEREVICHPSLNVRSPSHGRADPLRAAVMTNMADVLG